MRGVVSRGPPVGEPRAVRGHGEEQGIGFISSAMRCDLSGPGEISLAYIIGSHHVSQRHLVVTVSEIITHAEFCSYILEIFLNFY
jgi:hypothetical protein